jgi:gluconolactonase
MKRVLPAFVLLALPAAVFAQDDTPIEGIGPTGKITKLFTDFEHSEGPAADGQGNVYFSDVPASKIYKVDAKGKLTTFAENTGHANGLFVGGKNAKDGLVLYACRMDGDIVAYKLDGAVPPEKKVVIATYNGKPFNAPNDLVFDKQGGMYFTDPALRAPGKTSNIPGPLPQDKLGIYYLTPDGKISRISDDLNNPNGVKLSPDEKTLYVVQTGPAEMMAYPVEAPGKIGTGLVF